VRPSQEFSFDGARTKLSNLRLESEGLAGSRFLVPADSLSHTQGGGHDDLGYTEDQGRLLYLGSSIDLENLVSIGCAGALLTYLQRQRSTRYLQDDPAGSQVFVVRRVTMLTLRGTM
jgi:DNA mismatch repair protein MSH5